jgi:tetratricopeptide (TPR) repeat protein
MLERAYHLIEHHRYSEAEQFLRDYLLEEPEDAGALVLLAISLHELKNTNLALPIIEKAISLAPDEAYVHQAKGSILFEIGNFRGAQKCAELAIALDPENTDNYSLCGQALASQGKSKAALEKLRAGLELDPENTECRHLLSLCLTNAGDLEQSEVSVAEGLRQDPLGPDAHAQAGFSTLQQNQAAQAMLAFEEALRLDPENEFAREGLLEALKVNNLVFRACKRLFKFLLSSWGRAGVLLIILFLWVVQTNLGQKGSVTFLSFAIPRFAGLYLGLLGLTIFYSAFFDLLLLFGRRSRLILTPSARLKAILLGTALAIALGCLAGAWQTGEIDWALCALYVMLGQTSLIFPFPCPEPKPRKFLFGVAALTNGAIATGLILHLLAVELLGLKGVDVMMGGAVGASATWILSGLVFNRGALDD